MKKSVGWPDILEQWTVTPPFLPQTSRVLVDYNSLLLLNYEFQGKSLLKELSSETGTNRDRALYSSVVPGAFRSLFLQLVGRGKTRVYPFAHPPHPLWERAVENTSLWTKISRHLRSMITIWHNKLNNIYQLKQNYRNRYLILKNNSNLIV